MKYEDRAAYYTHDLVAGSRSTIDTNLDGCSPPGVPCFFIALFMSYILIGNMYNAALIYYNMWHNGWTIGYSAIHSHLLTGIGLAG